MRILLFVGVVVLGVLGFVAFVAPFALPSWAYDAIYGWRYPRTYSCGDAEMVDYGPATATGRYVVDLGRLHSSAESRSYRLCNLPPPSLVPGLSIRFSDREEPSLSEASWHDERRQASGIHLTLSVLSSTGDLLLEHSGDLGTDWTWSGPDGDRVYVYARRLRLAGGSGSRELVAKLEGRQLPVEFDTILQLRGGGWK